MATPEEKVELLENARESLSRMQKFEAQSLVRAKELGEMLSFRDAVSPAEHLIGLYQQLPQTVLELLPYDEVNKIKNGADADYNRFDQILQFDPKAANAPATRTQMIDDLQQAYDPTFKHLYPWISYSVARTTDFRRLEDDARSAIQSVRDETEQLQREMQEIKNETQGILDRTREVAAEQGVSQRAVYFKKASEEHDSKSNRWLAMTICFAIVLGIYAIGSLFIHKFPILVTDNLYQTLQIAVSKVLIFAVISYMLLISTRNFLAHKHNAIVNKHRQNALLTFQALVDAAKNSANQDIVLTHAAACIFSPQPTGYSKAPLPETPSAKTVVEMFSKSASTVESA